MRENNYIKREARNAQIVDACDRGDSYREVARQFELDASHVREIYRRACWRRAPREWLKKRIGDNGYSFDRASLLETKR